MFKLKPIKGICISFRDDLLDDPDFVKTFSKSKTQAKTFPNEQDWQDLANIVLNKYARLLVSNVVESISVTYYE